MRYVDAVVRHCWRGPCSVRTTRVYCKWIRDVANKDMISDDAFQGAQGHAIEDGFYVIECKSLGVRRVISFVALISVMRPVRYKASWNMEALSPSGFQVKIHGPRARLGIASLARLDTCKRLLRMWTRPLRKSRSCSIRVSCRDFSIQESMLRAIYHRSIYKSRSKLKRIHIPISYRNARSI